MFVALEGIDASGKTTQAKILAAKLGATLISFPDYMTPMGKLIEAHLKREWRAVGLGVKANEEKLDAMIFQALQLSNRMEHAITIESAVLAGQHVVADRYTASGMIYGAADGLDSDYLERIHEHLPQPTHWLLIDIDPEQSVERRPERRDRYETQAGLMHEVALRYHNLWAAKGWTVIDGRGTITEVTEQIFKVVTL